MKGFTNPEFSGKRVLITGGTQGIGKAIARRLGDKGAVLFLNYAHSDRTANDTLDEFRARGFATELSKADIGSSEAIGQMLKKIHETGPLDMLVCNAAYQEKNKDLFETDLSTMATTIRVISSAIASSSRRSPGKWWLPGAPGAW